MITINTQYGTVDMSRDAQQEYRGRLGRHLPRDLQPSIDWKIAEWFEGHLFQYIVKYMRKEGYPTPRDIRMLVAHGESLSDDYMYIEKEDKITKRKSVNDWLKKYDGDNHDALVLLVCNEGRVRLEPRRSSFLIYPSGSIHDLEIVLAGMGCLNTGVLRIVPPQKHKRAILKKSKNETQ